MRRSALELRIGAVIRRERVAEAARLLTRVGLPLGLVLAAIVVVAIRRLEVSEAWMWAAALPGLISLGIAGLRPRSRRAAARRLDRHFGLEDLLGNALELGGAPAPGDPRTAAIIALMTEEAERIAGGLDPRPAVRIVPPGPGWQEVLAAGLLGLALLVPRAAAPTAAVVEDEEAAPAVARAATAQARGDRALLEPLRQELLGLRGQEDAAGRLAAAMLEVLDAYGRGEIDREAAFARLSALEGELAAAEIALEANTAEDPGILAEGVRALAEALKSEALTAPAGEHLARGEGEQAEAALASVGEAAAAEAAAREALDRAMKAAEQALGRAASEQRETAAELAEAERRLKKQEKEPKAAGEEGEEQERRLKQQQEKVESLRREHEREKAAQRALEQLRRDAQAAQGRGQGGAKQQEQQQRALERLARGASEASAGAQRQRRLEQARDGIEEAKSFLRRSGQQGEGKQTREEQMRRFGEAAKGQQGKHKGKKKGPTLLVEGKVGEGPPDALMEGDGGEGGQGEGAGDGDGDGDGEGEGKGQGEGASMVAGVGGGMGEGSADPLGEARGLKTRLRDVRVDPKQGRGASRAEVIATASQEGFASASYRDVFTDYKAFAQSSMDRETVPQAQRRQIKRYFQMIQPRR